MGCHQAESPTCAKPRSWRAGRDACPRKTYCSEGSRAAGGGGRAATALVVFIIVAFVIFVLLYAARPEFVMRRHHGHGTKDVDTGRALLWSVVIAFFIAVILFAVASSGCGKYY